MITKQELIDVLNMYFTPLFWVLGAVCAVLVIGAACYVVIRPFVRRV